MRTVDTKRPEPAAEAPFKDARSVEDLTLQNVKPAVRSIKAYNLIPHRAGTKINQNENPFDMPEGIKQEVMRRLASRPWSRYPAFSPAELLERLAAFSGWRADGILAGNGSNELIQAVLMVVVGSGARVVIPEPTFTLYRQVVTVLGGEVVSVPLTAELRFDASALSAAAVKSNARAVIVCSPNNPTGCVMGDAEILELARSFEGLVIVDEAYHEFAEHTVVPLLETTPNLIVLRTFSKAMAMAGLRVGYMLASPELAREVHKGTLPYNLNFLSATAAIVACEKYDEMLRPLVLGLIAERDRLLDGVNAIPGARALGSRANFFLVKSGFRPGTLFDELLSRDILVRDVSSYPMLSDYLRFSVGRPQENDALLLALNEIVNAQSGPGAG